VASFGSRVRDKALSVEAFDSVIEAQTVMIVWKDSYSYQRPHSSLGWRPLAACAASPTTTKPDKPARLSLRPDRQTGTGHLRRAFTGRTPFSKRLSLIHKPRTRFKRSRS
jgi:hypothetical protein